MKSGGAAVWRTERTDEVGRYDCRLAATGARESRAAGSVGRVMPAREARERSWGMFWAWRGRMKVSSRMCRSSIVWVGAVEAAERKARRVRRIEEDWECIAMIEGALEWWR